MSFEKAMFESGKSQYYQTIYDQFYLNRSGVCNVHCYIRESGGITKLQIQHHCCCYI